MGQLGLEWVAHDPPYEEEHGLDLPPEQLVVRLAVNKAKSVAPLYPDSLVVGSDQLLCARGGILHKPATEPRAMEQLARLSGETHLLMTSIVVLSHRFEKIEWDLDLCRIRLRPLSEQQIREYVERERPMDCAGGLKVEGLGINLVESMSMEDPSAVVGLPLIRLSTLVKKFGIRTL